MAAPETAEVKLGAETSGATSALASAASSIRSSLDAMRAAVTGFTSSHKAAVSEAVKNNANLSRSFVELRGSAQHGFDAIGGVIARVRGIALGLTAVLGGGALFKGAIDGMLRFEDEVRNLEITMGMAAPAATQMAIALKLAGSNAEEYGMIAMRVQQRVNTQPQIFEALGVAVKDANGALLPTATILQNVYTRMQDFKAGADQNAVALATVGRGALGFANTMSRLGAAQQRAIELQKEYDIDLDQSKVEAYRMEVNAFSVVMEGVGDKIAEAVMPSLMALAHYFSETGPTAIPFIVNAVRAFLMVLDELVTGARKAWLNTKGAFDNIVTYLTAFTRAMNAVLHGGFSEAYHIVADANKRVLENTLRTNQDILGLDVDLQKRIADLWSDHPTTGTKGANLPASGKLSAPDISQLMRRGGAGSDTRLAEWRDELEQMQEAEGYFHAMSKEQEAEFWQAKLALVTGYGKQDIRLRQEINRTIFQDKKAAAQQELAADLETMQREIDAARNNKDQQIAIAEARTALMRATFGEESKEYQRALDEELKIREAWQKKEQALIQDAQKFRIEMAKLAVDNDARALSQEVALRQVSADQKYAIERELEDRCYALDLQALEETRATLQQGTLAYQQNAEAIEKLELEHQQKLTDIDRQAELERRKDEITAAQDFQSDFASAIDAVVNRTKSLKNAFLDFFKSLEQQLSKIASDQIAKAIFGPGTQGNSLVQGFFGKIFGGGGAFGGLFGGGSSSSSSAAGAGALSGAGSSSAGIVGALLGPSASTSVAAGLGSTTTGGGSQGLLGSLFGSSGASTLLSGLGGNGQGGGLSDLLGGASSGVTAAFTALQTAVTTVTTGFTALDTVVTTLQGVMDAFSAAVQSATSALQAMAASGGGGGAGGLLGGFGGMFGLPMFAAGTPYVPRDMLAVIHKGEAIIPAGMNRPGGNTSSYAVHNYFNIAGGADARSQGQIAAAAFHGMQIAARRHS